MCRIYPGVVSFVVSHFKWHIMKQQNPAKQLMSHMFSNMIGKQDQNIRTFTYEATGKQFTFFVKFCVRVRYFAYIFHLVTRVNVRVLWPILSTTPQIIQSHPKPAFTHSGNIWLVLSFASLTLSLVIYCCSFVFDMSLSSMTYSLYIYIYIYIYILYIYTTICFLLLAWNAAFVIKFV